MLLSKCLQQLEPFSPVRGKWLLYALVALLTVTVVVTNAAAPVPNEFRIAAHICGCFCHCLP